MKEWMYDLRANKVSSSDWVQEYKWLQKIDEWHRSRANVQNQILASTTKSFIENIIPSTHISCQKTWICTPTSCGLQDKKKNQ